jgi:hypothetical protein
MVATWEAGETGRHYATRVKKLRGALAGRGVALLARWRTFDFQRFQAQLS